MKIKQAYFDVRGIIESKRYSIRGFAKEIGFNRGSVLKLYHNESTRLSLEMIDAILNRFDDVKITDIVKYRIVDSETGEVVDEDGESIL